MNKTTLLILVALATPRTTFAQTAAAATYQERYAEVMQLAPVAGQSAEVSHLVMTRDAGQVILERGRVYLLSPVGGRTVGAVFQGEGRFRFAPPVSHERAELQRFAGDSILDTPFSEAVLLFSDSTAAQLRALPMSTPPENPRNVLSKVRDLLDSFKGDKDGSFDDDIMGPMLNGADDGFYLAWLRPTRGDPFIFQVNPADAEAVQLRKPVSRRQWGANWAIVTQFPTRDANPFAVARSFYAADRLRSPAYQVETTLSEAVSANLGIRGRTTVQLVAGEPIGPWLLFNLHWKLDADSARWSSGEAAPLFKADDDQSLWIRAPHRMAAGDSLGLTIFYHGDMIDRVGNFFFVDPLAAWYPVNSFGRPLATFDLTYHAPKRYPLISIGERRDSTVEGNVATTRWVTRVPTSYASFNLGLFQPWHIEYPEAPPLDVYLSDDAHNLLRRQYADMGIQLPEQRNMREAVAGDVSNSLKFFTALFGQPQYRTFSISEIPYSEGVSFPGFIHLSWGTFQNTSLDNFDQFFRAHEVAHQWWGNDVTPGTYRDAWLSEGLATFCGIWYVQAFRRRDNEYYRFLDQYRADIDINKEAGPISIGGRLSSPRTPRGYSVLVYEKGAWIFHMLRTMMLDLGTMRNDRFNAMMRDFYSTYRGRLATTEDFRAVVERATNTEMAWFFDEWVNSAATPTYRVSWTTEPAAEAEGRFRIKLHVVQEGVPRGFRMPVLVSADLGGDRTARFRVMVSDAQTDYVSPLLPARPASIIFNANQSVLADVKMN